MKNHHRIYHPHGMFKDRHENNFDILPNHFIIDAEIPQHSMCYLRSGERLNAYRKEQITDRYQLTRKSINLPIAPLVTLLDIRELQRCNVRPSCPDLQRVSLNDLMLRRVLPSRQNQL
jgi:hypothetical protein